MVLALCDRFHALPSQVLAESTDLLRYMNIEGFEKPDEGSMA